MPHFCANVLEVWHCMNPTVNPNIQSVADLRRTPIRNSTPPPDSTHLWQLHGFGKAWTILYVISSWRMVTGSIYKTLSQAVLSYRPFADSQQT
jgi:hypothetical protein